MKLKTKKLLVILWIIISIAAGIAVAYSQTVEAPRAWLTIVDHSGTRETMQTVSNNPSYTALLSDYKPISRKLANGKWEVTFVSEIAQDIP